ncbi:hypothetical protein BTJ40_09450 [Microbulbifer sp. A4B17]|nr:hypothetical protein BTJ40_09450 [Microbulbifer sp. A4B17]
MEILQYVLSSRFSRPLIFNNIQHPPQYERGKGKGERGKGKGEISTPSQSLFINSITSYSVKIACKDISDGHPEINTSS